MSAGWVVSGAADPAVCRNDQGRNVCADGIGDIAAAVAAAAADGISRAATGIAIAEAGIINHAIETEAAVVTYPSAEGRLAKAGRAAIVR
jgi:hypothetical protein